MHASRAACSEGSWELDSSMTSAPKVAITGAGSGFGAAMARRFAAAGYELAVTDINQERADSVMAELEAAGACGNGLADVGLSGNFSGAARAGDAG